MHPLTQIRQNLRTIRERYGVARIGIFGSLVRDEATAASDLDIPVEFRTISLYIFPACALAVSDLDILVEFRDGEETFDRFMDLKFYLEDLLERRADLDIIDTVNYPGFERLSLMGSSLPERSSALH